MAITRSQQAKQMLRDGGRTGFRIGSDEGNVSGREYGGSSGAVDTGDLGSLEANVAANQAARDYSDSSPVDTGDLGTQAANVAALRDANRFRGDNRLENAIKLLSPFSKERQKALYNLSMGIPGQKKRSAKYQKAYKDYLKSLGITEEELEGELPSANFFVDKGFIDKPKPEDAMLPEPMSYGDFLLKEFNNPTVKYRGDIGRYREEMGLDNDDPPLLFPRSGIMAQAPEEKKEEDDDPVNLRLLAEGGRAGFQEGGGIEQRLEKLGGDVTSAEKLLQGINKRLETAESSLGSGGGGLGSLQQPPPGIIPIQQPPPPGIIPIQQPIGQPPAGGGLSASDLRPMGLAAADGTMSLMSNPLSPQQRMEQSNAEAEKLSPEERVKNAERSLLTREMKTPQELAYLNRVIKSQGMDYLYDIDFFKSDNQLNVDLPQTLLPAFGTGGQGVVGAGRSSGIPAAGYADGGNVVGGEYDFESARQMYGLGKLVKKITRSVKKIAKSPIGKAAIGAALFQFGKPLVKSEAFKNFFLKDAAKGFSLANLSTRGALTGIAGISALGGLTAEEDDEEQLYVGADFPNPVDFYLSGKAPLNTRLAAEGGLMRAGYQEGSKEPVAKKTMPLLDMGGMEKDYREEGGFVPIGRMEKADDVPARLSKNEFVFTADAVRNAGDGDVDLGAEKMYNMMKNLEAGGDVSEESQGLKGAREMFQTSQRLEEVL